MSLRQVDELVHLTFGEIGIVAEQRQILPAVVCLEFAELDNGDMHGRRMVVERGNDRVLPSAVVALRPARENEERARQRLHPPGQGTQKVHVPDDFDRVEGNDNGVASLLDVTLVALGEDFLDAVKVIECHLPAGGHEPMPGQL